MTFADLGLAEPIVRAVAAEGYAAPTPIQSQAIPPILRGADLLGCAQTGTGKTGAFALPILHRLAAAKNPPATSRGRVRALILAPTRELAAQIAESFQTYGRNLRLRQTAIYGGVGQHHQVKALQQGVDILIATPGRLLDLMGQGHVHLQGAEIVVLDESDRMLDMGFIHDIRRIARHLPERRQTLLFSATMPADIRALADSLLRDPTRVSVTPVASTVETIRQSVYHINRAQKLMLLHGLVQRGDMERTIIFTRTKHGADKVVRGLVRAGIRAEAIHGNKSQNARTRALNSFKSKRPPMLVATDIASRGIDVDGITHVINFDLPDVPETYVHRIGRTARAGATGAAISFCDPEERGNLRAIERLTRQTITECRDQAKLIADLPQQTPAVASELAALSEDMGHEPRRERSHSSSRRFSTPREGGEHRAMNAGSPKQHGPRGGRKQRPDATPQHPRDQRPAARQNADSHRRDDASPHAGSRPARRTSWNQPTGGGRPRS